MREIMITQQHGQHGHREYTCPRCKILNILEDEELCYGSIDDVGNGGDIDGDNYNSKEMDASPFAKEGEQEEGGVWY